MGKKRFLICLMTLIYVCLFASRGMCVDKKSDGKRMDRTEALIILLKGKGIVSDETADFLLRQRDEEMAVDGLEDILKRMEEMERLAIEEKRVERLEKREKEMSSWFDRFKLSGDFRFRYQGDNFNPENAELLKPDSPDEIMNTRTDRHRGRLRMRLALKAKVNDRMEIGSRLTTGNEKDPVSTNDTIGDYFNKDGIVFDNAYLKWFFIREKGNWLIWQVPVHEISISLGRMPNPFDSTDLVWDSDINLEGLALQYNRCSPFGMENWRVFGTAGMFPIQEVELSSRDKWLAAGQMGMQYYPETTIGFKLAIAYYDYHNIEGELNYLLRPGEKDYTAPSFQQKGNTLFDIDPDIKSEKYALASDFNQLNINGAFDIAFFFPVYIQLIADYVNNLGFDQKEVSRRSGSKFKETEGYQVGTIIGHKQVKQLWQWNFAVFLKHLDADAVIDAFTDSDFHLGGTNAEGWILRSQIGVGKNAWISLSWLTSNELIGPPNSVDVLQVDINANF
ncbi:putative porin [bacterium]|nr:putative porin [bacterium]